MRILHTSDWHLGASIKSQDVGAEHEAFLDWLLGEIEDRQVDVLVVAGDVFHYATPSNTARQRYYEFLVECARRETLEQVIVVGGNHDSPSGLDAPRDLLRSLDIHVVGGLPYDEDEQIERCLVPVGDPEAPDLVVAAVPYARRAQLGVALEDDSEESMHQRYQRAFGELYGRLAEAAAKRFPGVPCVATGHLTCYADSNEPEKGDYHSAIHGTTDTREFDREDEEVESVGTIGAMQPDAVFGDDYEYVALGHIHRMMPVGDGPVYYSGTPVATSKDESSGRYVLQVDFESAGDEPSVEALEVPTWRELKELSGPEEQIIEQFDDLDWESELPPYLFLDVEIDREELQGETQGRLQDELAELFPDADERPRIVSYREYDPNAEPLEMESDVPPLEELSPREVFVKRYQRDSGTDGEPPEELEQAFEQIRQAYNDRDRGE